MPGTDVAYGLAGECEAGGSDVEHGGDGAEEDDFAPQIIIHEPDVLPHLVQRESCGNAGKTRFTLSDGSVCERGGKRAAEELGSGSREQGAERRGQDEAMLIRTRDPSSDIRPAPPLPFHANCSNRAVWSMAM
eukprot:1421019-Rhodomonas_salina.2